MNDMIIRHIARNKPSFPHQINNPSCPIIPPNSAKRIHHLAIRNLLRKTTPKRQLLSNSSFSSCLVQNRSSSLPSTDHSISLNTRSIYYKIHPLLPLSATTITIFIMHKSSSDSTLGPGGLDLSQAFFRPINNAAPPSPTKRHNKISVIGAGNVGMAIAQTILTQDLTDELVLVDTNSDKLRGEMLDLQHAAAFLPRTKIHASADSSVTAGSDLCIVTAGARQISGESRLNLLQRNLSLFRAIIPPLVRYSPDTTLLIVSNPVDVLTYVAWKLSGFPSNRVIGSGTNLDSSRFRFLIADHLDVNAQDVQAYIVGEHGDSSVALWSSISIGGVPVLSFLENQQIVYEKETLENIHKSVIDSAYEVIKLKGYTSWAIGYSVANLARSFIRNQRKIHPVSVLAKGFYGIDGEVFLSLPAMIGRGGILGVTNVHLNEEETQRLRDSAKTILEVQTQLGI